MKTKTIKLIALLALVLTPVAIFAQDSAPVVDTGSFDGLIPSATKLEILAIQIAAWYGVACAALNGLAALVAAVVKKTPGDSDDKAVDKFYASGLYKAVAWIFSWGDYVGELVTKLKK